MANDEPVEEPPSLLSRRPAGGGKPLSTWDVLPATFTATGLANAVVHRLSWGQQEEDTSHLFTVIDCRRQHTAVRHEGARTAMEIAHHAVETLLGLSGRHDAVSAAGKEKGLPMSPHRSAAGCVRLHVADVVVRLVRKCSQATSAEGQEGRSVCTGGASWLGLGFRV